jgi:hypothetical protein
MKEIDFQQIFNNDQLTNGKSDWHIIFKVIANEK